MRDQAPLLMNFGEDVHAPVMGHGFQFAGETVVDHRHDEEDAVGTPGAGFGDLIGIEHEILAQYGQEHTARAAPRIFGRALEGRLYR